MESAEEVLEPLVDAVGLLAGSVGEVSGGGDWVRRRSGHFNGCEEAVGPVEAVGSVEGVGSVEAVAVRLSQELGAADGIFGLHGRRRWRGGFQILSGVGGGDERGVCSGRDERPLWRHVLF